MGLDMYVWKTRLPPTEPKINYRWAYGKDVPRDKGWAFTNDQNTDETPGHEELHQWRKHYDLHSWFRDLFHKHNGIKPPHLQCLFDDTVTIELETADLDDLEQIVETDAFPIDYHYSQGTKEWHRADILEFIAKARYALSEGYHIYYWFCD